MHTIKQILVLVDIEVHVLNALTFQLLSFLSEIPSVRLIVV